MDDEFAEVLKNFANQGNEIPPEALEMLRNSKIADEILAKFEKDYDGDLDELKKRAKIGPDDPPFLQIYKIFELDKDKG